MTAVKATCKVKADFVVLPDNFARCFIPVQAQSHRSNVLRTIISDILLFEVTKEGIGTCGGKKQEKKDY